MLVEAQVLGYAVLLAVVQLVLYGVAGNLQLGVRYTAGPRDEERRLSGAAGRLQRAFNNHIEGLVLYIAAVVLVSVGQASSVATETAAWIYLAARCAYLPAYLSGAPYLRSAIWAVGFFATLAIVVLALVGASP